MSGATDLLLHLRPCKIDILFEGVTYTIPALDAVQWMELMEGDFPDLYEIFPRLAGQDAIAHVEEALWEGRVSSDEVGQLAFEAFGANADRPWWVAVKVIYAAKGAWDVVGSNNARGMSLAGWLDDIWRNIMTHIDPKKKAGFVSDIESPPKRIQAEINYDAEEVAFLNAMKAVMR